MASGENSLSCEESLDPVDMIQFKIPYQINLPADEKPVLRFVPPHIGDSPGFPTEPNIPSLTISNVGRHDSSVSKKKMSEILNSVFPPIEWTDENKKTWKKEISDVSASRQDVIRLHQNLNMALKQRQARETGICPIRRELYSNVFDELIRQVTLNNTARGLLLVRIRDEIQMTLMAHANLFENAFAYGTVKGNIVTEYSVELEEKLKDVTDEKNSLEFQIQEYQIMLDQEERKYNESRDANEKKATEEIQFLKRANQQLRAQLDGIQSTKRL